MPDFTETLRLTLTDRIGAADRAGAVTIALGAVAADEVTIPGLYDVLARILVETGGSWQDGDAEVWQEHLATGIVRTIVEACYPTILERAGSRNGHSVILATPPEEYHDLGLRMMADRFTLAGWRVDFLGASVPDEQLAHAVTALGADAVVLSASTHFQRMRLRPYVDGLRYGNPGLRIWVTGPAFAPGAHDWPADQVISPASVAGLAAWMGA
jgi:methanogenic corrinoid protein MtbC1